MSKPKQTKLRQMRLKHQFRIIIICTLCLVILLQMIYVSGFSNLMTTRAQQVAMRQMTKVEENINTSMAQMQNCAATMSYSSYVQEILLSDSARRNYELYPYVMEMISSITTGTSAIYSAFLMGDSGRRISDPVHNDEGVLDTLDEQFDIRNEAFIKPAVFNWLEGYRERFYTYVFPIFHSYLNGDGSKIGCGVFVLDTLELSSAVQAGGKPEEGSFYLLDNQNRIIASNREDEQGSIFEDGFWEEGETTDIQESYTINGRRMIAQYRLIESTGWKIVSLIPRAELTQDIFDLFLIGLLFSLMMIICMYYLQSRIAHSITEPVSEIAGFLGQVGQDGDISHRLNMPYPNEIGEIAENVDLLLDKVQAMTRQNMEQQTALYDARLEEKQALLMALQSQVNPHFLYNTLNCISSIGMAYGAREVSVIASAVSDIFRYSIKGDHIVTVAEELDCIRKYLKIMDIRYQGRFTVAILVADELLECSILKMILQPLVENSMYHGLEQTIGPGKMRIEGRKIDEDRMQFTVRDNGKGINAQALQALRAMIDDPSDRPNESISSHGLGLRNISKRIKLQLGAQYGLTIDSKENEGTCVTLVLPICSDLSEREEVDG